MVQSYYDDYYYYDDDEDYHQLTTSYSDQASPSTSGFFDSMDAGGLIGFIFIAFIVLFTTICQWKIFTKAGEKGWASIVPIYNIIVMFKIAGVAVWQLLLFLIPGLGIIPIVVLYINLAKKFGKSAGFGVLTAFFPIICLPMLAFNKNIVYGGQKEPIASADPGLASFNEPVVPAASSPVPPTTFTEPVYPAAPAAPVAPVEPAAPVTPPSSVAPASQEQTAPQSSISTFHG